MNPLHNSTNPANTFLNSVVVLINFSSGKRLVFWIAKLITWLSLDEDAFTMLVTTLSARDAAIRRNSLSFVITLK